LARSKSITASELLAQLHADPEWVRKNEERDAERRTAAAAFRAEERPIIVDILRSGLSIDSLSDLINSSASYPEAVPVLLDHLQRRYSPRIREAIIRALTVREARGQAGPVLLNALASEDEHDMRWVLANALTVAADRGDAEAIAGLVDNPRYEDVRERLSKALKRATPRTRGAGH